MNRRDLDRLKLEIDRQERHRASNEAEATKSFAGWLFSLMPVSSRLRRSLARYEALASKDGSARAVGFAAGYRRALADAGLLRGA